MTEYMIKVRKRGTRPYWFLSGAGGMNRLRIHALRIRDIADMAPAKVRAENLARQIETDNTEYETKVVRA